MKKTMPQPPFLPRGFERGEISGRGAITGRGAAGSGEFGELKLSRFEFDVDSKGATDDLEGSENGFTGGLEGDACDPSAGRLAPADSCGRKMVPQARQRTLGF